MSTNTANYNLVKPNGAVGGDLVDVNVINSNMDIVDTQIKARADAITVLQNRLAAYEAAWAAYTPTLNGIVLGNGTITGRFLQIGKSVDFQVELTLGSTTTFHATINEIGLPVACTPRRWRFMGEILDAGVANYGLTCRVVPTNSVTIFDLAMRAASTFPDSLVTNATPIAIGVNDVVTVNGRYEAA